MKLTNIEYSVLMQAIYNAKCAIADDEFIDPYAENTEGWNNENLAKALDSVENKLIDLYTAFDFETATIAEIMEHVKDMDSVQFSRGGYFYDIDEHSEGGYYYSRYASEQAFNDGDDDLDGGLCTSTISNAVEMALS